MRGWFIASCLLITIFFPAIVMCLFASGTASAAWALVLVGCCVGFGLLDIGSEIEKHLKRLADAATPNRPPAPPPPTEE